MTRSSLTTILALAATMAAVTAQTPAPTQPAGQQAPPVFRTGTTAVLLDIVVRDKRGHPIRDLRQDEIAVLEDGAPRELKSFRLVEGAAADGGLSTPGSGVVQPDPLRRVTLVSLVFDHLGQNARKLAQKAAQDYLKKPLPAGQWVAVFSLDNRLHMLQDFSRNVGALSAAVERATATVAKEGAVPLPGASRWSRCRSPPRPYYSTLAAAARTSNQNSLAAETPHCSTRPRCCYLRTPGPSTAVSDKAAIPGPYGRKT
jgi:VWFA-related protein